MTKKQRKKERKKSLDYNTPSPYRGRGNDYAFVVKNDAMLALKTKSNRPGGWVCVRGDLMNFGLSREDAQDKDQQRFRSKGQPTNPGLPVKWPLKGCI